MMAVKPEIIDMHKRILKAKHSILETLQLSTDTETRKSKIISLAKKKKWSFTDPGRKVTNPSGAYCLQLPNEKLLPKVLLRVYLEMGKGNNSECNAIDLTV